MPLGSLITFFYRLTHCGIASGGLHQNVSSQVLFGLLRYRLSCFTHILNNYRRLCIGNELCKGSKPFSLLFYFDELLSASDSSTKLCNSLQVGEKELAVAIVETSSLDLIGGLDN